MVALLSRAVQHHALLSCRLAHVLRIERVQNPHLWTKYCLRRHEVEVAAGAAHVNEQLLFHGCHRDIVTVIGTEGFDIRVAGMSGSLGAGTYFAGLFLSESSHSNSLQRCRTLFSKQIPTHPHLTRRYFMMDKLPLLSP